MSLLDTFAEALEQLRSLPIIRELWHRIRPAVTTPARRSEALDFFLTSGYSIRQAAAMLTPGTHGPAIVALQNALEAELRGYTIDLEARLFELQQTAAQATGAAAVKARQLDSKIAALERENKQLHAQVAALLDLIEHLRSQLAEAAQGAKNTKETAPAAAPA